MNPQDFDDECEVYVRKIASVLEQELGPDLVGVYLHGSASTSGFLRRRSDIDMIAVNKRTLDRDEKQRVATAMVAAASPCPGTELEFHLVTQDVAANPSERPPWELIVSTADDPPWRDGTDADGDTDLVAHFAMTKERGRSVVGPPPDEVFGNISLPMLMRSLIGDLQWASQNAPLEYLVLNACRCIRLVEERDYGSKIEAGEWAMSRFDDYQDVIDAAIRRQRGHETSYIDRERVEAFVDHVMPRLEAPACE